MKRSLAIAAVSVLLAGGAATAAVVAKDGRHHHRPKATTTLPVVTTRPAVTTTTRPATTTTAPVTTTTVCGFGPGPAGPVKSSCVSLPQVNVKAAPYNAVCNGTVDDTTAVQAAANASAGKMLYFPAGTCRVSTVNVPATASVGGVGPSSIIKQTTLTTFNDPSPVFDAGGSNTFSSIKIDGNSAANKPDRWSDSYNDSGRGFKNSICCGRGRGYRSGIRGESITGLTVDNVEFTAIAGAALATNMSSNVTLTNSNIHDTDFEAAFIYGDGSPVQDVSGSNVNITNNTITNLAAPPESGDTICGSPPVLCGGVEPDGIVVSRVNTGTVSGNTLNGVDRDFLKLESDHDFVVSGNHATTGRVGYPSMQISPFFNRHDLHNVNIRVTANTFTGPGFFNGVQINSDDTLTNVAQNIEVDHNTIVSVAGPPYIDQPTGTMRFGIQADGNTGLTSINIHDNAITNTSSFAIYVYGGGTGLILNTNTHNGSPMSNVSIAGSFPCCTHTYN